MGYSTVKSIEKAMSVLELLTDRALENRPLTHLGDNERNSNSSGNSTEYSENTGKMRLCYQNPAWTI